MSRISDTILGDVSYAQGSKAPVVNLNYGGQFGATPNYPTYMNNTPYVRRNIIALLISAPLGFQDLDNPDYWTGALKALVEVHAKSISGLNQTFENEYSNVPVGGAGEIHQTIMGSTRQRSEPQFTWPEKYGRAINKFLEGWSFNLIMDPETKYPRIISTGKPPTDLLSDYTGMTVLFIEPDPTMTKVVTSWLSTNMQPTSGGEKVGSFDKTQAGETLDLQITFTALTQVGAAVDVFAQSILSSMNLSGMNPNTISAFQTKIDSNVSAQQTGFSVQLNTNAKTSVTL